MIGTYQLLRNNKRKLIEQKNEGVVASSVHREFGAPLVPDHSQVITVNRLETS